MKPSIESGARAGARGDGPPVPIEPWEGANAAADGTPAAPYAMHDALHDLAAAVDATALARHAAFSIAGRPIDVASNAPDALDALLALWRPFLDEPEARPANSRFPARYAIVDVGTPAERSPLATRLLTRHGPAILPPMRSRYVLVANGRAVYATVRLDDVVSFLDWTATTEALTSTEAYGVFHGAVLDRGGRGLLLPAVSGSGKTTLTAALIAAGFGYLSDEAALVDPATGRVDAYPQRLSIKRPVAVATLLALPPHLAVMAPVGQPADGLDGQGQVWRLDPALLMPGCLRASTTVAAIVFPRYDPAGVTALHPLGRGAAALRLLRHAVNERASPPRGVAVATSLVAGAACYGLTVNSLPTAVHLVADLFDMDGA